MPVSAVILTYNDKETITGCLDSVEWCDEIVIVDSYSDDGSEKIVAERADIVIRMTLASEGDRTITFAQRDSRLPQTNGLFQ